VRCLVVRRADGVIELHPLEPQPDLLAWGQFTCPHCCRDFTISVFDDGENEVVVLETVGPVADDGAPS
jgi:hypothetical protein